MVDYYTKEWFGSINIYHGGSVFEVTPHNFEINMPSNSEPFSCEVKWINNNKLGNTIVPNSIYCGDTIEIYAGTLPSSSTLLFRGRIFKIGSEYTGDYKVYPEHKITAYGFLKDLMGYYRRGNISSNKASTILTNLAIELKNKGVISDYSINVVSDPTVKKISGDKSYHEIIEQICNDANLFYYVDHNKVLKIGSKGSGTLNGVLTPDFQASIEWDTSNIINTLNILGSPTYQIGSDLEYSEDTTNWTGYYGTIYGGNTILAQTTVSLDSTLVSPDVGDFGIRVQAMSTICVSLMRTFDTALDLSYGGNIHFVLSNGCRNNPSILAYEVTRALFPTRNVYRLCAYNDYFNYFYTTITVSGGSWKKVITNPFDYFDFENRIVSMDIGYNNLDDVNWLTMGNPSWNSISVVGWHLLEPLGSEYSFLVIDDFYFKDQELHVSYANSQSVSKYGVREGQPIRDSDITSEEIAQLIAQRLVNAYSKPTLKALNIRVDPDKIWSLPLGYNATISVGGINAVSVIDNIKFSCDGKNLSGDLDLSDVYVPKIENIFKKMKSLLDYVNWDIGKFKSIAQHYALLDNPTDLYGWERVSNDLGFDLETNYQKYDLLNSSSDYDIHSYTGCTFAITFGRLTVYSKDGNEAYGLAKYETFDNDETWRLRVQARMNMSGSIPTSVFGWGFASTIYVDEYSYFTVENFLGLFGVPNDNSSSIRLKLGYNYTYSDTGGTFNSYTVKEYPLSDGEWHNLEIRHYYNEDSNTSSIDVYEDNTKLFSIGNLTPISATIKPAFFSSTYYTPSTVSFDIKYATALQYWV